METKLAQGLVSLHNRAIMAKASALGVAASSALSAFGVLLVTQDMLLEEHFYFDEFHILEIVIIFQVAVYMTSWVLVGAWIYQAHTNLERANLPNLEFTPGWAVGWYFVPIANLFKPFQAMRELWNASHGTLDVRSEPPGILWVWWLTWIASSLGGWGDEFGLIDAAGFFLTIVSAAALWKIIDDICKAQPSMSLSSTFD